MKTITGKIFALALAVSGLFFSLSADAACNAPTGMNTTAIGTTAATFNWTAPSGGAQSYNIRYRVVSTSTWATVNAITALTYTPSGLSSSSNYEWQVQSKCSGTQTSSWTSSTTFTTLIVCNVPTGLSASGITATGATLNWNTVSSAQSYNIQYRIVGAPSWTSTTSSTNSKAISSLTANSNYEWQVQTNCGSSNNSAFSSSSTFSTLIVCSVPTGLNTINITTTSATLKWLAVNGAQGYNVQYRVAGSPTWSTTTATLTSVLISSLNISTSYEWNVQTNCGGSNTSAYSSIITFNTGSQCVVPSGLTSSGITATSVTLNWAAVSGAQNYNVQYRKVGAALWALQTSAATTTTLTSLTASDNYEWQVQAECGSSNSSSFSAISTFSTTAITCDVPTGTTTTAVTSSTATFNWNAVSGALGYKVQYREIGGPSWISVNLPALTNYAASWLASATIYEWQVQAVCGNSIVSALSTATQFTTAPVTSTPVCNVSTGLTVVDITGSAAKLNWIAEPNARGYNVQYRIVGAPSWTTLNSASVTSSVNLSGLEPASNYEWQVQTICRNYDLSAFSGIASFSTISVPVCGSIPTALNVTAINPGSATLAWNGGANVAIVSGFDVRYRELGSPAWNSLSTVTPSITLSSLSVSGTYEWQVRTNCGGAGLSSYSTVATFSMLGHVPVNTTQYFDANNVPTLQNPASWNTIFVSSGNPQTDAQIVHDWLLSHGCIKE